MSKKPQEENANHYPLNPLALEAFITAQRSDPEFLGWERLKHVLNSVVVDPEIVSSQGAEAVAQFIRDLVFDANDPDEFALLLESKLSVWRAKRKGIKGSHAKAWVQGEWNEHKAAYDGNKSEFARAYQRRLAIEKDYKVGVRQITDG